MQWAKRLTDLISGWKKRELDCILIAVSPTFPATAGSNRRYSLMRGREKGMAPSRYRLQTWLSARAEHKCIFLRCLTCHLQDHLHVFIAGYQLKWNTCKRKASVTELRKCWQCDKAVPNISLNLSVNRRVITCNTIFIWSRLCSHWWPWFTARCHDVRFNFFWRAVSRTSWSHCDVTRLLWEANDHL